MATTLSNNFVKPATGDRGSVWFVALEGNIQKLNDHTHDGSNSERLTSKSVTKVTDTISSGSWSSSGSGYKQTVTMPSGMNFDDFGLEFRNAANDYVLNLTVEKVTATTYDVYISDNTLNLTVLYT